MIVRDAIDVPGFRNLAATKSRKIRVRGPKVRDVALHNKNRHVHGYFAEVVGKTGYTRAAGRCFAGAAIYEGREVIVVILGARDLWGDTQKLIEWAHRGGGKDTWPRVQMAKTAPAPAVEPATRAVVEVVDPVAPAARVEVVRAVTTPSTRPGATRAVAVETDFVPSVRPAALAPHEPAPRPAPPSPVTLREPDSASAVLTAREPTPRSAALTAREPTPRSAALVPAAPAPRSAALAAPAVETRSASYAAPSRSAPQRVAAVQRGAAPPAYVQGYEPTGNVRRGCTGVGCTRDARYYPAR
jgi:D-alanyl-D-alanine carboxypeptidase